MKKLILVRHGEAESQARGQTDFARELTERGIIDALRLGVYIAEREKIEAVLCSDAVRTLTTARYIAEKTGYDEAAIVASHAVYQAPMGHLVELIGTLAPDKQTALLVGHNPTITFLAEYLSGSTAIGFAPASAYAIAFACDDWGLITRHSGTILWEKHA